MGILLEESNEKYHSKDGISSTAVKTVYKSTVAHWKGQKRKNSAAFNMGSAVHANLLQPADNLVVKGPKTKKSKAFVEMEEGLGPDQILLTEVEFNVANCITKGVMDNPAAKKILEHPDRLNEASIYAKCPRTGLMIKCKPDTFSDGIIWDVKTTQTASPSGFAREVQAWNYDLQGSFYLYVCSLLPEIEAKQFGFIAVEKAAPYVSHLHIIGPELMASATERMYRTLDIIAAAEHNQDFGTGWGECSTLELPKWL